MTAILNFFNEKILVNVLKILGIFMVCTVLLQISARNIPNLSIRWTEEMARLTFLWFSFLGASLALNKKMHLSIDFLYNKFNEKVRQYINYFVVIIVLLFSILIMVYGIQLVNYVSIQKSPVLRMPMAYFYAPVPVSGFLFSFNLIAVLEQMIRRDFKTQ